MELNHLERIIGRATKWSIVTEVMTKLMSPITSMILARLLTPEVFGVVATVVMITSFGDVFADAGFQKYLIQHEFTSEQKLQESTNVAFWSNVMLACFLWFLIFIVQNPLAIAIGNPGLGHVIVIACISMPLTALSSVQTALFRREFDFKALFFARIIGICIPLLVTLPLAWHSRNYWALIVGNIATNLANAIVLTLCSTWKPKLYFRFAVWKEMFSFGSWSLLEQITIWITASIGTFLMATYFNAHHLGIYKTSMGIVNQMMAVIAGATTPVVFSALSRLQYDADKFNDTFLKFQRLVGLLIVPMGVGIYLYRDFMTTLLLGNQWHEASGLIGLWSLMSAVTIVFGYYCSEVYRALGRPKLSVLSQSLHLVVLVPVLVVSAKQGFEVFYIARSLMRLQAIAVDLIIMWIVVKITPWQMLRNVIPSMVCSGLMALFAGVLNRLGQGNVWIVTSIVLCAIFYVVVLCLLFRETRDELLCLFRPYAMG